MELLAITINDLLCLINDSLSKHTPLWHIRFLQKRLRKLKASTKGVSFNQLERLVLHNHQFDEVLKKALFCEARLLLNDCVESCLLKATTNVLAY